MQKAVELRSQGLTLRGMLHMPDNTTHKVPVVVLFHGLTGSKMEPHFIFVKLSRMLEKKGIASVRFDFGGSGESDGDFINMTLSGEIRDAHNILDYAKELDGIDSGRIGLLGLSMGGSVASALAGERKDEINSLCLWAPAGNVSEVALSDKSAAEIDFVRKIGYVERGGLLLGSDFIDDILNLNIFETAKSFGKKVLIIHGDKDTSVPLSVSEKYLKYYDGRAELKIIKDADHTFNNSNWEKKVLEYTTAYFEEEL